MDFVLSLYYRNEIQNPKIMQGKNFVGTKNNPKETPEEFLAVLKRLDAVCGRVQLERGE